MFWYFLKTIIIYIFSLNIVSKIFFVIASFVLKINKVINLFSVTVTTLSFFNQFYKKILQWPNYSVIFQTTQIYSHKFACYPTILNKGFWRCLQFVELYIYCLIAGAAWQFRLFTSNQIRHWDPIRSSFGELLCASGAKVIY